MTRWGALIAGALGTWAAGCGPVAAGETSGAQVQAIVDGEPSGAEQDGVVLLRAVLEDKS
jgi:hypothetical protein